jgi:sterol desaturase/sphingolipid hydroxylase (fatty acid hydroxylase superfamily)
MLQSVTKNMTRRSDFIEAGLVALLIGAGLASATGPRLFYGALLAGFAGIAGTVLVAAGLTTLWAERSGRRLQGVRRSPALLLRGVRDTALAALIAACFLAWPLSRMWSGAATGLTWSLEVAGGGWRVALQTAAAVLVLDAWLYFKHRLLHTRLLFPFHRAHHIYRDPTAFASFAVGPVESLLTFWPIILVALPQAPHYAPVYFALVGGFVLLNLYLHCGVALPVIEAVLPRLYVNTSAFHNRHHANADVNFGEALTLWDHLLGTREGDGVNLSTCSRRRLHERR